ncbi:MAG: DUF3048 domain-containing protein [Ruminococcus sp.]|nr:DUF3048 domain-containing protein [Ruminococcus sp.]
MLKKAISAAAAMAMLISAAGCETTPNTNVAGGTATSEIVVTEAPASEIESNEATAIEETVQPPVSEEINPLTGEIGYNAAAVGKRPVAVMVNNIKEALPQYGIEQADIIYELPVEGGITRLMAVYADYTAVPDVCSVRSCRYYYPLISLGMDAIYCHWGSDKSIALDTLNRTGIDHLDGEYESGLFYRDQERAASYSSEHIGYLKGSELADKIAAKGFRTDVNAENSGTCFNFALSGEKAAPSEMTANTVTVNFSNEYFSTFSYDAASGNYLKLHSGAPHVDGKTGTQLAFENVFVLQTYVGSYDGYLLDIGLSGGTGYYISNGGAQTITWSKPSESSPIEFYAADGSELTVNVGESYIGIIGSDKIISFS